MDISPFTMRVTVTLTITALTIMTRLLSKPNGTPKDIEVKDFNVSLQLIINTLVLVLVYFSSGTEIDENTSNKCVMYILLLTVYLCVNTFIIKTCGWDKNNKQEMNFFPIILLFIFSICSLIYIVNDLNLTI